MSKFGLWWVKWNGSGYKSRMSGTAREFRNLGFDSAVVLFSYKHIRYTGNGREDAHYLSRYLQDEMDISYYAPIPFFNPSKRPVGDTAGRFEGSYWAGWIEDFMTSSDTNLKGFYWTLENAWMFKEDQIQKQAGISFSIIRDMAESIHNNGFEFIWIPSACTLNLAGTNIFPMGKYPGAFEFFDYVFVQPNYYQKSIISDGKHTYRYNYEKLVEWIRTLESLKNRHDAFNVFMEMEADRSLLYNYISKTHIEENFRESLIERCGPRFTHECLIQYTNDAKETAFQYITAQKDALGWKYGNLAYYFSVDFDVIREMEGFSRRFGEEYV
ncbi:DUF4855 domain-containing protein [Thermococcus sp. JdF3]|uniref:DUF4855 domain-containing protein n=1 Tax=Thermococcus sp. JdF3 TaxID=1638258 RepID=UPI00143A0C68|nr:DUF4855 domain-containing protein [Thermococcus sp. JdF3]NJE00494.1 DUF4855 domain-containing protein [Thermococcus sp. JdF3]